MTWTKTSARLQAVAEFVHRLLEIADPKAARIARNTEGKPDDER